MGLTPAASKMCLFTTVDPQPSLVQMTVLLEYTSASVCSTLKNLSRVPISILKSVYFEDLN